MKETLRKKQCSNCANQLFDGMKRVCEPTGLKVFAHQSCENWTEKRIEEKIKTIKKGFFKKILDNFVNVFKK